MRLRRLPTDRPTDRAVGEEDGNGYVDVVGFFPSSSISFDPRIKADRGVHRLEVDEPSNQLQVRHCCGDSLFAISLDGSSGFVRVWRAIHGHCYCCLRGLRMRNSGRARLVTEMACAPAECGTARAGTGPPQFAMSRVLLSEVAGEFASSGIDMGLSASAIYMAFLELAAFQ